jgi:hypothetical protein
MFARLGVDADLLASAGVFRVTDIEARGQWGFQLKDAPDLSGIVFPYRDPESGDRLTARLRRDNPEVDSDGKPESKYLYAYGDKGRLFFPPGAAALLNEVTVPMVFVESEKAALAVTAAALRAARKLLVIATGGCWGWRGKVGIEPGPNGGCEEVRGPLADLDRIAWTKRKAIVVFDSNASTKPGVAAARRALAKELGKRAARVYIVDLPEEPGVNGPDDLIAVGGGEKLFDLIDGAEESKPSIILNAGESPLAVDDAEEILCARFESLKIFERAGEVVRLITLAESKDDGGLRRRSGSVFLVPVSNVALTELWERLIEWQKPKATKAGFKLVRVDCPSKIAAAYLSRIGLWRLPHLAGIISAPIMRPDGTVLCRAGYDVATGLFLTEDWPHLDGNPSREDALAALKRIEEPFAEFPFLARADRSAFVAGMLTAVQRRLLKSAPLFGSSAPTPRTGKSLLAECLSIVGTGRVAPAMAVSSDREEMRKAVLAALREGHSVVNLDNIEHPLASPDLARAITQPQYSDRVLGESRILTFPTNLLWTATGNNLTFRGDLAVRALVIRLDSRLERPEERNFRISDLKAYVAEHRRDLVTASLTILRAFVVAGRPEQAIRSWGGFDEWSATIRAPLVWLGAADPCDTREHVIEDDPDREQAGTLLSAWYFELESRPIRISELLQRARSTPDLESALLAVGAQKNSATQIDPRRVASWCRAWCNRVVKGHRLERDKDYGDRATWKVCAVCAVSAVRNPQIETDGAVEDSANVSGWPETDRTDRSDRKTGQDGRGEITLFDAGALEL